MKRRFFLSITGALAWMLFSTIWSASWIRDASGALPPVYALGVIAGIALLPGYLMSAMFLSNLMHTHFGMVDPAVREPVTVLICARNEAGHIYRTIQSITSQRYAGTIDVLCVDNGSRDTTREEIAQAIVHLQRPGRTVRLLRCPIPGKAYALNAGLARIQTRYFVTVDADTRLQETAICAIMHRLLSSGAACVAGNLLVARADNWVQKMQIYDYLISIAAIKRYQGSYGATLVAQGAFSAYRTQAVRETGGWTQGAGEDIVLTYRLLARGDASLYAPQAIGYTEVPRTLGDLSRQRIRWARGMFEGLRAVKPWQQPGVFGGYFEALNLSIVYLDLAYTGGFLVGVVLALMGMPWLVGLMTLLTLPLVGMGMYSVYRFQTRIPTLRVRNSAWGLVCFLVVFQPVQSLCSLRGYAQALTRRRLAWK